MKLIVILLLTTSCASGLRSYRKVTTYTEIGVKCAQEYYYSFRYGKCIYIPSTYSPSGVSVNVEHIYKAASDVVIKLNKPIKRIGKIDCKVILANINKCSL